MILALKPALQQAANHVARWRLAVTRRPASRALPTRAQWRDCQ